MSVIKLFLALNMIYFCGLNKTLCQPGVIQGLLKTRLMYLFGIFQEILLPQPRTFKKVSCTCSQTGVFREYSLSQPSSTSKFLAFARKKNCQYQDSIYNPFVYIADVIPCNTPSILMMCKDF
jgi:hypothetical protein